MKNISKQQTYTSVDDVIAPLRLGRARDPSLGCAGNGSPYRIVFVVSAVRPTNRSVSMGP